MRDWADDVREPREGAPNWGQSHALSAEIDETSAIDGVKGQRQALAKQGWKTIALQEQLKHCYSNRVFEDCWRSLKPARG